MGMSPLLRRLRRLKTPLDIWPPFKLDEDILNELLANITISALSLNRYHDMVEGNVSHLYNVYRFERRLNLFLPYGLCLLVSILILVVGLLALRDNGTSAIDGGFLQILMTAATGETEIERAARGGDLGGEENVPERLKRLKVRFGEFLTVGQHGTRSETPHDDPGALDGEPFAAEQVDSDSDAVSMRLLGNRDGLATHDAGETQIDNTFEETACATKQVLRRRAGFGTNEETQPLRRR
jgi:hypothetical protein